MNMATAITFDEYDKIMEEAEAVRRTDVRPYFPSEGEILKHAQDRDNLIVGDEAEMRFVMYIAYLVETNPAPSTETEQASMTAMKKYLKDNLILVDTEAEAKKLRHGPTYTFISDFISLLFWKEEGREHIPTNLKRELLTFVDKIAKAHEDGNWHNVEYKDELYGYVMRIRQKIGLKENVPREVTEQL